MALIPITLHFVSLVPNAFLIHGIQGNTSLIQKLFFAYLWDIVINIKDTSAFIRQARSFLYLAMWFLMNFFFPYKNTQNQSMVPPTSHVISIFDSWLPHINSPHSVAIESQLLTPPCTSPLPTIPLLTSISNSVAGSSTNATSQPETAMLPPL